MDVDIYTHQEWHLTWRNLLSHLFQSVTEASTIMSMISVLVIFSFHARLPMTLVEMPLPDDYLPVTDDHDISGMKPSYSRMSLLRNIAAISL